MEQEKRVGVIGLGAMGSGIVSTLLRAFYEVGVFDINAEAVKRCASAGALPAASAAELAGSYDTIMLSLPRSQVTVEVLEREVLPAVHSGATIIDLGTTVVAETERLAEAFRRKDAFLLDAPVSGGAIGSAKGQLYCFVGGDRKAAERNWTLFQAIGGARLTYCGPSGCGQITKAVNQLAMGLVSAAYTEAIAFGVASGVDADVLLTAIGGTSGFRAQFDGVASRVVNGAGDAMDHKYAEFEYFIKEADRKEFDAPILRGLSEYLKQYPESGRDNMNRPYAPFWSALLGKLEERS